MRNRDKKRSLYQCFHAKVLDDQIYCEKESASFPPRINIRALARGFPLVLSCCQNCKDYDEMGPPVEKDDRGWFRYSPIVGHMATNRS